MDYKVTKDCIGCGLCAGLCPDVFEMSEDGYSHVHANPRDEQTRTLAEEAMTSCPTSAIVKSE